MFVCFLVLLFLSFFVLLKLSGHESLVIKVVASFSSIHNATIPDDGGGGEVNEDDDDDNDN